MATALLAMSDCSHLLWLCLTDAIYEYCAITHGSKAVAIDEKIIIFYDQNFSRNRMPAPVLHQDIFK